MAGFQSLIRNLRRAEQQLAKQLEGIRSAISSLEFGSAASPGIRVARKRKRTSGGPPNPLRARRKLSAKARAAISRAQKKRWANLRKDTQ
jgi:hypothetical protein